MTIVRKVLWDQRRSLLAWASAIAALVFLESAMWSSMDSMAGLDEYLADFPAGLRELFGLDEMATGRGFLNAELFTLMLPLLFLVYGVSRGARSLAGEEEAGTLDLLLVTPLSTTRLLVQEACGLVLGVLLLGLALVVSTVAGSLVFDLRISVGAALVGALAEVLLGMEFGCIALVAGALTGRRASAMEVAGGLAMAAYLLYVGGLFVGSLAGWRALSPFDHVLRSGPLSTDLPVSFAYPLLVALAVVLVGLPLWSRRDIGAGR